MRLAACAIYDPDVYDAMSDDVDHTNSGDVLSVDITEG